MPGSYFNLPWQAIMLSSVTNLCRDDAPGTAIMHEDSERLWYNLRKVDTELCPQRANDLLNQ